MTIYDPYCYINAMLVGDGQVREVVLQQSSEFDEERQKNATSTLVFEMNHANGQWRKVKRKKYSKAD